VSLNNEVVTLMLVFGAAWGFVRLITDAIVGGLKLSLWTHRKLLEWSQ